MTLVIPEREFGGYIFDCDGTLADTMPLHYRAWKRLVEELGGPIAEVRVSGGWAANPVLRRLKLAAFPNTIYPRVIEAGARGAALPAGMAAGAFSSVQDFPPAPLTDELAAARAGDAAPPLTLSSQPNESPLP